MSMAQACVLSFWSLLHTGVEFWNLMWLEWAAGCVRTSRWFSWRGWPKTCVWLGILFLAVFKSGFGLRFGTVFELGTCSKLPKLVFRARWVFWSIKGSFALGLSFCEVGLKFFFSGFQCVGFIFMVFQGSD